MHHLKLAALYWSIMLAWVFVETQYFLWRDGWHYWPASTEEWICDGIGALFFLAGLVKLIQFITTLK